MLILNAVLLNLVILLAKYYIHKSKISIVKPKFEIFVATLRDKYFIERNMYSKHGKEQFFSARWSFVP